MAPPVSSQTNSSDYYEDDDPTFLEALATSVLPGDITQGEHSDASPSEELEPPPPTNPSLKRKRLESYKERTKPVKEDEIYGPSHFGNFGEYMRRKRAKLQIQNTDLEGFRTHEANIFQGLSIYINGYTQPSIQDLRKLIVKHGGVFQPYLDKKSIVTHIVTCSLTAAKMRDFKYMKVIRPEWLVDSANKGTLLPWQDFVFAQNERSESTQGSKIKQASLLNEPSSALLSTPIRKTSSRTFVPPKTPTKQTGFHGPPESTHTTQLSSLLDVGSSHVPQASKSLSLHQSATSDASNKSPPERPAYASHTSNQLAQRVMANPDWRKAHTSVAPDFIEGYYKHSRLHHLSTWKAELKSLVQEAQERAESGRDGEFMGRIASEALGDSPGTSMRGAELVKSTRNLKGKEKAVDERVIMHCDFDCFFVSAGLVSRPELRGKPVVVCHSQGAQGGASSTSEIASSSYEAREFGIRNGMSLRQARELCPTIVTIPYEFERYKQLSLKFYTILMSHADDLQAVSVDEALIDVTNVTTQLRSRSSQDTRAIDPAKDFAESIRAQVLNATGCEVSIGISHNILLARLATRRAKPGGSYHLLPHEVQEFLSPLSISDLHGFGSSVRRKAEEKLGVTTLGALMDISKAALCDALGKSTGETLYNVLRGNDDKRLESDKTRKSVSCEINYGIRFENNEQAEMFIYQMAKEVSKRLDDIGMIGRSITLKIMKRDPSAPVEPPKFLGHGACHLYNKQIPLIGSNGQATSDETVIGEHAFRILRSFKFDPKELRGLGIQMQKLENPSSAGPAQQALLPFGRITSPKKVAHLPQPVPQISLHPPSDDIMEHLAKQESPIKTPDLDLPSFSQVDMQVFDALPQDVREELQNEYKRRSTSPFVTAPPPPPPPLLKPDRLAPFNKFPRAMVKGTNFRRIAQQQRPRNRPMISPLKSALFKKNGRAGAVKMSDAALRELDIDPEVFHGLPPNVQHEQLTMLRLIKQRGKLPSPPLQRKVLKPHKRKPIPAHLLWRAPPPQARFVAPPILRQQVKHKKEKLFFTETSDIQGAIEGWVNAYRRWSPKQKDIEFFTKYLVSSVDGRKHTDVSMERAVAVLKWWLVLLRRHWGGSEYVDDEDHMDPSQINPVGDAWWKAFRQVKRDMDTVARERFGGCLSLK